MRYLFSAVLGMFLCSSALLAQDPCEEAGYVLSSEVIDASCPDSTNGTATVNSTGCECFTSGCTFEWSDGQTFHTATDLAPGAYTVVVTHPNGCVLETEVTVGAPDKFVEGYEKSDVSCYGAADASLRVVPMDFAGMLTYEWSNGATTEEISGVGPGEYQVTVTNFLGCQEIKTFNIAEPARITAEFDIVNSCNDLANGSAYAMVEGGMPPYDYQWSDLNAQITEKAENLTSGNYFVAISDANGCEETFEVEIESGEMAASASADLYSICAGKSAQLEATGGTSYLWSPATGLNDVNSASPIASPTETTTYTVMVQNGACSEEAQLTIEVESFGVPDVTAGSEEICVGSSTNLFAIVPGQSGISYNWMPTEGLSNPNSNATLAQPTETTTYTLIATNAEGCQTFGEITLSVNVCSSVTELTNEMISIFPNPTINDVHLQFRWMSNSELELNVYNMLGSKVKTERHFKKGIYFDEVISLSDLSTGVYYMEILVGAEKFTRKVIKE